MASGIAVVILTLNEEPNLPYALTSVIGWADEVLVLDSFSTDCTVEVAKAYGAQVIQHPFENYSKQRNYALTYLPIRTEWVFFLDADEWLPATLKEEISRVIEEKPDENGFYVKRRLIWMGRWIRRGYYPTWILRLFRFGHARCEERAVNEHLIVDGKVGYLTNDLVHEDRKSVGAWIEKHNRYAEREAMELFRAQSEVQQQIDARFCGTQAERKRWLRYHVWNRLPPLIRPFFYFVYRYILRGGFLDGRQGFIYHFLQALWFPVLIDVKYLELRRSRSSGS